MATFPHRGQRNFRLPWCTPRSSFMLTLQRWQVKTDLHSRRLHASATAGAGQGQLRRFPTLDPCPGTLGPLTNLDLERGLVINYGR